MRTIRRFSTSETLAYMTGWGIICAVITFRDVNFFSMLAIVLLPGVLIAGPVGFAFGGRSWFWPAAVVGSVLWLLVLLLPAVEVAP